MQPLFMDGLSYKLLFVNKRDKNPQSATIILTLKVKRCFVFLFFNWRSFLLLYFVLFDFHVFVFLISHVLFVLFQPFVLWKF